MPLCQYFRVFFTPISTNLETIDHIITTCAVLHNLMRNQNLSNQDNADISESIGSLPDIFIEMVPHHGRQQSAGNIVREKFVSYFKEARNQERNLYEEN